MKISVILLLFFFLAAYSYAQESTNPINSRFDVRAGFGSTLLGTGDMRALVLETELNYRVNAYLSTSASINFGRSINGVYISASYIQGNLNVFVSPLKNTRKNDFRIGTGLTVYDVFDVRETYARYDGNGQQIEVEYAVERRSAVGFNVIVENTYTISKRFLIGAKIFSQFYDNGDVGSGVMLKLGVRL